MATAPARRQLPGATIYRFRRDPVGFLSGLAREQGDLARFQIGPQPLVLLSHPELIREVLVAQARSFVKGRNLQRAKVLLGEGLLTSEGEHHRRQRRLIQPAFHRRRLAGYAETMSRLAAERSARWRPGAVVDLHAELMELTLAITGETLFGADTSADSAAVAAAMHALTDMFEQMSNMPGFDLAMRLGLLPARRRFAQARASLDAIVYRMIAARRAAPDDRGDLLSTLLLARDEDGGAMSDLELRDEALTIFLAGHETTANALAWTFYLLSQYPDVADSLAAEARAALGDRAPSLEDLPALGYAERVFAEAMRLYPPAWVIARRAVEPVTVGGERLEAGTLVLMSQWVVHHDPRFFPDPYRLDPGRWEEPARAARPRFAYFPFGGGPRICVGEQFAWLEGALVLASLARDWRPAVLPGHPVRLQPSITLRPRAGLLARLEPR